MRRRHLMAGATALGLTLLPAAATQAAQPEPGSRLCTWGGTVDAPTGWVALDEGVNDIPTTEPQSFVATGPLAGGGPCTGRMTFRGTIPAGSSCNFIQFEGKVEGLPGVATFAGPGAAGIVHETLFDRDGNVVGSDQPQVLTNGMDALSQCHLDRFREGEFSATIELYPSYGGGR